MLISVAVPTNPAVDQCTSSQPVSGSCDVAVVGAGAAGLMAAIWAARSPSTRVIALDGAKRLGAKILVAGGGRCNVTHHAVDESQYAGSTGPAIRKVLRRFDVADTVAFFAERGVELKQENTGKLFPITDDAHTVLNALLGAAADAGVELAYPRRVQSVAKDGAVFRVESDGGPILARRVVLATGGRSLPKSGSDGHGYSIARSLGHSLTPIVTPALVPLTMPKEHWLIGLSGITVPATLELRSGTGKKLKSFTNSLLIAHFGISGPAALDISRYWTHEAAADPSATLSVNWLCGVPPETLDQRLLDTRGVSIGRYLDDRVEHATSVPDHVSRGLPERLAHMLCAQAGVHPSTMINALSREQRRLLVRQLTQTVLPITGDRGYLFAEVTAGGVPLSEVRLETMESRCCPGIHLCGEILDVDGRIGGFNFQWAWASGYAAGQAAGRDAANGGETGERSA